MVAKRQGETASDLRSLQREREREKRRVRDRQRRQNMSLEQRERHLARRRRNYQLRRIRAENAKLRDHQNHNPTSTESQQNAVNLTVYNNASSGTDPSFTEIQTMEKSVSTTEGGEWGFQKRPRRLRIHQIRQLARLLSFPVHHRSTSGYKENGRNKRLRMVHIKRLARALKSGNK